MVRDFQLHQSKEGKEYWTFHLVVQAFGQAVDLAGWKYFVESGTIRPPQFNIHGKYVSMVLGLNKVLEERIRGACVEALGGARGQEGAPAETVSEPKPDEKLPGESWVEFERRKKAANAC